MFTDRFSLKRYNDFHETLEDRNKACISYDNSILCTYYEDDFTVYTFIVSIYVVIFHTKNKLFILMV